MATVSMIDIAQILEKISKALQETGYEVKGFDNMGKSLKIFIEKKRDE